MAKLLDKQRYKCALGAMQTVQAIERAIPILHSGPGCAQKLSDGNGSSGLPWWAYVIIAAAVIAALAIFLAARRRRSDE